MIASAGGGSGKGNVLVLVRHGESEWNKLNLFTGWKDPDLTEKGVAEAQQAGQSLKAGGLAFDVAYTSDLKRAQRTLSIILDRLGQTGLSTHRDVALNERDYGDLSGLNKDDARKRWGESQVHIWRRSYDIAPPGGESLKDTAARVLPYYEANIRPEIAAGRNVLVVAHGNSLRALIMQLEGLSGEEIIARELGTGVPIIYRFAADGTPRLQDALVPSRT
jgi:2,3-bisphosphoglycerate-dependent phosphoglycerate mutase